MLGEIHGLASAQGDGERLDLVDAEVVDRDLAQPSPEPTLDESAQGLRMARTSDAALDECVTLRSLLDATPGLIALVEGEDHVLQFANSAWLKIAEGDVIGRPLRDLLPKAEARDLLASLDGIRTGGHAAGSKQRHTVVVASAGQARPIHLDFACRPMTGPDGGLRGILLEGADVTDRVLAHEHQQLLMNELIHRVKNTSATMLGLARLARNSATDLDTFVVSLSDRIVAMARTQDLLITASSQHLHVKDVLRVELQPYLGQDGDGLVDMTCQDLTLAAPSAISLSMIVHELLTNAVKYGALAAAGGRLRVDCMAVGQEAVLTWSETTLQRVGPMGKRGFGSRLIERLAQSLGGQLRFEPRQDGLDVTMTFEVDADIQPPAPGPREV
jgi:two-component sensor histidine kinase